MGHEQKAEEGLRPEETDFQRLSLRDLRKERLVFLSEMGLHLSPAVIPVLAVLTTVRMPAREPQHTAPLGHPEPGRKSAGQRLQDWMPTQGPFLSRC